MFIIIKKKYFFISILIMIVFVVTVGIFGTHTEVSRNLMNLEENDLKLRLPVVMYHSVLASRTSEYIVSPEQLEGDLKYIRECGYTTISIQDMVEFVFNNKELPKKSIVLTFDDGYYNNLYYAQPLLEQYNMHGVIFVVGEYSEVDTERGDINPNYSYLTWDQISEMSNAGVFEIQNHTYHMHNNNGKRAGAGRVPGESMEDYEEALMADITQLNSKIEDLTGMRPIAFAYPFGKMSKGSMKILKAAGLKISFTSNRGISELERGCEDSLFGIKRILRSGKDESKKFFEKILY